MELASPAPAIKLYLKDTQEKIAHSALLPALRVLQMRCPASLAQLIIN